MTAKEFVKSKYPNAICIAKRQPPSRQVLHFIYLTPNGKLLCQNWRENWAWAKAKRKIMEIEKQAQ
jgi:hypothetical protein